MKTRTLLNIAVAIGIAGMVGCNSDITTANSDTDQAYRDYLQPGGVMYFFEQGIPTTITSSVADTTSIATAFRKDGSQSLAWQLQPGEALTFNQPIGFQPFVANNTDQSKSTFMTWVYNDTAQPQSLRFAFSRDGVDQTWFDISLDFSGWRQLIIPYSDMQGEAVVDMDALQIRAGRELNAATLYFDQMLLSVPVDPRWPTRDAVVPYINMAADEAPNKHWLALYRYYNFLSDADISAQNATLDQAGVDAIVAKLDGFVAQEKGRSKSKLLDVKGVIEKYNSYDLVVVDGVVTGKPLDNGNRLKIFLDKGVNKGLLDDAAFDTVFNVAALNDYGELMLNIAKLMRTDVTADERAQLEEMYLLLTRYALTQGYQAGSALGTAHHMGYTLRDLFQAHYYNRDLLAKHGLAAETSAMLAWFAGTGRIYRPESEMTNFNVDIMNTQLRGMLYSILMQPDAQIKAAWLDQFSFWLSRSISVSHGLGGGFKADGSIFHHAQHYPAYGKGALQGVTPVVEALSRTPYAIDSKAHRILKNAVAMTEISSAGELTLMAATGRHPDGKQSIDIKPFMYMARAGSPDGSDVIDADMASAYLRLAENKGQFSRYLQKQGFNSSNIDQGNWAMNFANLSIQRRDGWVAAVRGFSRYLVGSESYANANRYGRYINYGQLEILNTDGQPRGFSHDGWNWNRWPGTTAVQLPMVDLNAQLRNVDAFSGLEEMLMSEQTYAGAISDGENGLYAMRLQGHPKYDASFTANKSVFFFDNRIIALGTGITSADAKHPVQTTLLQHALRQPQDKLELNGEAVSKNVQVNSQQELQQPPAFNVLMDPANNAYFVASDSRLILTVGEQQSLDQKNSKPTAGKFATAVLDHGIAPTDGKYAYAVLVDTDAKHAEEFAQQLQSKDSAAYVVEQQDNHAHIVWDRATNSRGYAFFTATDKLADDIIVAVDSPAMVLTTAAGRALMLTVVNPDLNLYQGKDDSQYDSQGAQKEVSIYSRQWKDNPSAPMTTQLTLKGLWQATQALPAGVTLTAQADGNTLLQASTVRAESVKLSLTLI